MHVDNFLTKNFSNFSTNYNEFKEAIEEKDRQKYINNIYHLGNLMKVMIEKGLDETDLKRYPNSLHGRIKALSELTEFPEINSLHFFRLTRNNIIHDENKSYQSSIDNSIMKFTGAVIDKFISYCAEEFFDEPLELSEDHYNEEISDQTSFSEDDRNLSFLYYERIAKPNIPSDVVEDFKPQISIENIGVNETLLIFDMILNNKSFDDLEKSYNVNKRQINKITDEYGFQYDFKEVVADQLKELPIFKKFVDDFFSVSNHQKFDDLTNKKLFLQKMIELYEHHLRRDEV